jgi:hypothetical protein
MKFQDRGSGAVTHSAIAHAENATLKAEWRFLVLRANMGEAGALSVGIGIRGSNAARLPVSTHRNHIPQIVSTDAWVMAAAPTRRS